MKYRLLAIDIDGTLIGADQRVPRDVREAVSAAGEAGLRVCLATGRSLAESLPVWRQLPLRPPYEPLVTIGGAIVCEPDTGRTLYQRVIPRQVAVEFGDALEGEGLSALAFVDGWRHGIDYYFAEHGDPQAAQEAWFSKMHVRVRRVNRLSDDPQMPCPARISAVAEPDAARRTAEKLSPPFAGRLNVHSIVAPNYGVTVVEAFSHEADKFAAVAYVAQAHRIAAAGIAAVGDDVNDLPMIRRAGLGVTFTDAKPDLRDAADHVADDGLAAFIHELIAGRFDG
ncbi:MAG TPA: HAD family hydrolase [Phycisphaerae bacterium]|nr:HAD family hydrolase [Phycisphaerae bacterium]